MNGQIPVNSTLMHIFVSILLWRQKFQSKEDLLTAIIGKLSEMTPMYMM